MHMNSSENGNNHHDHQQRHHHNYADDRAGGGKVVVLGFRLCDPSGAKGSGLDGSTWNRRIQPSKKDSDENPPMDIPGSRSSSKSSTLNPKP